MEDNYVSNFDTIYFFTLFVSITDTIHSQKTPDSLRPKFESGANI